MLARTLGTFNVTRKGMQIRLCFNLKRLLKMSLVGFIATWISESFYKKHDIIKAQIIVFRGVSIVNI